jgi:hypothetical protein
MRARAAKAPFIVGPVAALACILLFATNGHAATTTATAPFDADVRACNGDTIHLSGQLLGVFTFTRTASGGALFASHIQPQGVAGVDLQTGTAYVGTGLTSDRLVLAPSGTTTFTFVDRFHIQATGGASSYDVSVTLHVTALSDGTVTAFVNNFSASC